MNIVILTSVDHCYANALLNVLIRKNSFRNHHVLVLEQHGIIPGKSKFFGLIRYLNIAGMRYVFWQVLKQYTFYFLRNLRGKTGAVQSLYFPYWKQKGSDLVRADCPRLRTDGAYDVIRKCKPDLILSLLSKEIIPERIFTLAGRGCVNLHPAPLPFYRGVSPAFWVLANGGKTGGVTLHAIDKGIDTGNIISQELFPTRGLMTEHALYMKATKLGAGLVADFLIQVKKIPLKNMSLQTNATSGSYFSLPTKDAVEKFFKLGYSFFTLKEFLSS